MYSSKILSLCPAVLSKLGYAGQFGESIQQLFDSGIGILGVMSFFEEQGSGSTADQNLWAALDWTFLNRWSLSDAQKVQFYGSAANGKRLVNGLALQNRSVLA